MSTTPPNSPPWSERARALRADVRPWIGGRRVDPIAAGTFPTLNPASGARIADLPACAAPDVDAAVRAARAAFERGDWSGLSPRDRATRLHAFAEAVARHAPELALLDSLEMGMPIGLAVPDLESVAGTVHAAAEAADKLIDGVIPNDPSALVLNVREPVGGVGAITPWNFPADFPVS